MFGSLLGSVIGAYSQSKAAKSAEKISAAALAAQQAEQAKVWGAVDPYMKAGATALNNLGEDNYTRSLGYDNRLKAGIDGVVTSKAVNGLLRSGGALGGVAKLSSDMAADDYNKWFAQQQSIAQMGLSGAGIGAGVATQNSANIGANADNQANAALTRANAWSGLAGTLGGAFDRTKIGGSLNTRLSSYG